jgi:benzoylformate decarboxylase
VFLSLPVDVMEAQAEMAIPAIPEVGARVRGDRGKIEAAARILAEARNPAIISGDAVARSGAVPEVVKLVEMIAGRAHAEPLNGLFVFPTDHPLYAGPLFSNAKQTAGMLEGVDVLLTIGVNNIVPLVYTGTQMIPETVRLVQISDDPRELGKNYACEVAIIGDALSVLQELIEALGPFARDQSGLLSKRRSAIEAGIAERRTSLVKSATAGPASPMSAGSVALIMRECAPPDTVLVDESVTSTAFVRTLFTLKEPSSFFYAKAGSLGLGLPEAVGVKLAMPDRPVVCSIGDGTAMYSIQALWTAARYRLAVVFVVFNNSSYMILKGGLVAAGGASAKKGIFPGMDITDPELDFVKLAESMGVAARHVEGPADLRAAFEWAFAQSGPTLIDVPISREVRSVLR